MILSTNTELIGSWFGEKKAVEMIKNAGFDAVDYSMFVMQRDDCPLVQDGWEDYVKALKAHADSIGISFNQAHAPFPSYDREREDYTNRIVPLVKRSVEIAGMLGVKRLVVHPISPTQIPKDADLKEFNLEYYRSLLPLAKKWNVTVCLENMWGWDAKRGYIIPNVCSYGADLAEYLDELNDEHFTVLLDLGHSGLIGEDAGKAIRVLGGERLTGLHVHDNDYRNDSHTLPYYGKMDWEDITSALAEIKYSGDFTYEAANFIAKLPHDEALITSALRYMHDMGRYLIGKIENKMHNA